MVKFSRGENCVCTTAVTKGVVPFRLSLRSGIILRFCARAVVDELRIVILNLFGGVETALCCGFGQAGELLHECAVSLGRGFTPINFLEETVGFTLGCHALVQLVYQVVVIFLGGGRHEIFGQIPAVDVRLQRTLVHVRVDQDCVYDVRGFLELRLRGPEPVELPRRDVVQIRVSIFRQIRVQRLVRSNVEPRHQCFSERTVAVGVHRIKRLSDVINLSLESLLLLVDDPSEFVVLGLVPLHFGRQSIQCRFVVLVVRLVERSGVIVVCLHRILRGVIVCIGDITVIGGACVLLRLIQAVLLVNRGLQATIHVVKTVGSSH